MSTWWNVNLLSRYPSIMILVSVLGSCWTERSLARFLSDRTLKSRWKKGTNTRDASCVCRTFYTWSSSYVIAWSESFVQQMREMLGSRLQEENYNIANKVDELSVQKFVHHARMVSTLRASTSWIAETGNFSHIFRPFLVYRSHFAGRWPHCLLVRTANFPASFKTFQRVLQEIVRIAVVSK